VAEMYENGQPGCVMPRNKTSHDTTPLLPPSSLTARESGQEGAMGELGNRDTTCTC